MKNCYRQTKKNNQTNLRSTFVIVFMTSAETIFFVAYFMTFFNYVILFSCTVFFLFMKYVESVTDVREKKKKKKE